MKIQKHAPPAKPVSDAALLREIAARSSAQAFSALYDRYYGLAYALAMHLLGDVQAAEDAIQEAMVRIWRRAGSCRNCDCKAWILRIVANECMRGLRKNRRRGNTLQTAAEESAAPAETSRPGAAAGEELVLLRECLKTLPAPDRYLLTLYYGADLNQQEVGALLSMPQSSVSVRIRETLETLRKQLTRRGLGAFAVAPLLDAQSLRGEILALLPVAPPLKNGFLHALAQEAHGRFVAGPLFIKGAAAGVLLAAGLWAAAAVLFIQPPKGQDSQQIRAPLESSPADSSRAGWRPLGRRFWDFKSGPTRDLLNVSGEWLWRQRTATGTGCLLPSDRMAATLLMPVGEVRQPIVLRVRHLPKGTGDMYLAAAWADDVGVLAFQSLPAPRCREIWHRKQLGEGVNEPAETSFLFLGAHLAHLSGGSLNSVRVFESDYPGNWIMLTGQNMLIEELEIRPLAGHELPPECRDLGRTFSESLRLGAKPTQYLRQKHPHPPSPIR